MFWSARGCYSTVVVVNIVPESFDSSDPFFPPYNSKSLTACRKMRKNKKKGQDFDISPPPLFSAALPSFFCPPFFFYRAFYHSFSFRRVIVHHVVARLPACLPVRLPYVFFQDMVVLFSISGCRRGTCEHFFLTFRRITVTYTPWMIMDQLWSTRRRTHILEQ